MSNPAVITLDSAGSRKGKFKRFVIEDNIGEALHLHVDNMRVDFTIKEFLEFSSIIRKSLNGLDFLCGYQLEDFDECFLRECAGLLPALTGIKIEDVRLPELKCVVPFDSRRGMKLSRVIPVKELPAYKYLKGGIKSLPGRGLYDYFSFDDERRLLDTLKSFQEKSYPFDNKYIVLFNGQEYIRYGTDYAAVLGYLYGLKTSLKVMRFYFKGKDHLLNPFRENISGILKNFFKKRIKEQ